MTVVKEVTDGITLVADGIKNIKTIYEAIQKGRNYISKQHPEVKQALAGMCVEMQKTTNAVAVASAIITHFRFTVTGSARDAEPARFNEHLIKSKKHVRALEQQLNALRGRCGVIASHATKLDRRAKKAGMQNLFELMGVKSRTRERRLAGALAEIHNSEMVFHRNIYGMRYTLETALSAVSDELGPRGSMTPSRVRRAATLLGEYAQLFGKLESEANYAALQLQELITDLEREVELSA